MVNYRRKAISPVVATALLLVTAVVGVIGFQTWFGSFSSGVLAGVEESSTQGTGLEIENLIGDFLYVNNKGNSLVGNVTVKIGGVVCNLSQNFSVGINEVNVSQCLVNVTETKPEVVLIAPEVVLSKTYVYSPQEIVLSVVGYNSSFAQWIGNSGGMDNDASTRVFVDSFGNFYSVGYFYGNNSFSDLGVSFLGNYSGNSEALVVKFNSLGVVQWAKWFGGVGYDTIYDLRVDGSGNIYLGGYSSNNTGFEEVSSWAGVYSGGNEGFVIKLDSSGSVLWAQWLGGSSTDMIASMDLDSSGNIYVVGYSSNNVSFNDSGLIWNGNYSTNDEGFVIKLSSSGTPLWGHWFGGSNSDRVNSIDVDSSGNIYVVGYSSNNVSFNDGGLTWIGTYSGSNEGFVIKLSSSGTPLWGHWFGGNMVDTINGVSSDSLGNVYVGGYSGTNISDDSSGIPFNGMYSGGNEGFVSKLNSTGGFVWGQWLGGTTSEDIRDIFLDESSGFVYAGGYTSGTGSFDDSGLVWNGTYSGNQEGFVIKLNSVSGLPVKGYWFGGIGEDRIYSLTLDSSENLYVSGGYSTNSGSFDDMGITFNGVHDGYQTGFVIKLNAIYG